MEPKIAGSSPAMVNFSAHDGVYRACVSVLWLCVAVNASVRLCIVLPLSVYVYTCVGVRAALRVCARVLPENTHRGARTHDHKVKSLALCRLS